MKLRIFNETGIGNDTQVRLIDGDYEADLLGLGITRIDFKPIDTENLIEAAVHFYVDEIDLVADIDQETRNRFHEKHNAGMMAAMGFPRV